MTYKAAAAQAREDVLEQLEAWCCKEESDADEQGYYVVQSVFCQVIDKIRSLRVYEMPGVKKKE